MVKMIDPSGGLYIYSYDEPSSFVLPGKSLGSNLTSATYPDGKKRIYWYNEQDKTVNTNLLHALTGITDENGVRYATYQYKLDGWAVSTEHAGAVNKYTISYPFDYAQSQVTDPLGAVRTYNFKTILGTVKGTGQSQPAGAGCAAATSNISYDANGNMASRTDFNGVVTTYNYDLARNLAVKSVEASGTTQARTITTQWHPTYRLPAKIAEPKPITTNTYDAKGNLLNRTEQETSDATGAQSFAAAVVGTARTWAHTYTMRMAASARLSPPMASPPN